MATQRRDPALLAYDLGTTGLKATVFAATGELLGEARRGYGTYRPAPGAVEQDPKAWWRAACACTRQLISAIPDLGERIAAIGLSGMMNGVVLVDGRGAPVRPALIHADTRGADGLAGWAASLDPRNVYQATGCHLMPYFSLAKLAWLARHDASSLARARWCIQAKDYIAGRLTGQWGVTDPSDASLTGLYDVRARAWAPHLADAAGVPLSMMPTVVPSSSIVGRLSRSAARATGLRSGIPVSMGAGDGACATIGSGAHRPGDAYHYLGGTSWIAVVSDTYAPDPLARTSHLIGAEERQHVNYGTVQSAGTCVEWFLNQVGLGTHVPPRRRLAALQPLAAASPPGANGLAFLPYLDGERAPLWDPMARAAFVGLTTRHTRADLARAVLEGVAHALRHVLAAFEEQGIAPDVVRVLGGGMRSKLWRSIFSGVYGRPLHVLERPEFCTACGAAMIASCASGICSSLGEAVTRFVRVADVEYPNPDWVQRYAADQAVFESLYPALKPILAPPRPSPQARP